MNAKTYHVLTALCVAQGLASSASGQAAPDFYKGRQVRMIIGHPVGGDYDVGGRVLAKYLPKHIPGHPAVIVQNMPQASSIVAANFLQNHAPRDGTVFGSFSRNFASQALMGQPNIEADPRRFVWLGAFSLPSNRPRRLNPSLASFDALLSMVGCPQWGEGKALRRRPIADSERAA